ANVLTGGAGGDTLTGGGANDTFVFKAVTDSQPGTGQFDTITDFTHGSDHIDTTAIAGATLVQGAVVTASTVAANSISWFVDNAHNETIVYVNTTAAANHVDMEIHLTGTNINLTGADILHHA
ncbi:MAG: M10 family metallopeptidase C-terminal domain-containing protein, partial [Pseudolabrys sp.]